MSKALELAAQSERLADSRLEDEGYEWSVDADVQLRINAAELRRLAAIEQDCAQYLKEGETPAERIAREIADNHAVLGLLAKERQRIAELEAVRVPDDCDARRIMIAVEPDFDGYGVEVYAKTNNDVIRLMTKMGIELEEWQLGIRSLPAAPAATPDHPEQHLEMVAPAAQTEQTKCWCETCRPITLNDMRMVLCPDCGNKRCPRAKDHRNSCTGSNETGQVGSSWAHVNPAAQPERKPMTEKNFAVFTGATDAQVNWSGGDDPRLFLQIGHAYEVLRREVHSMHTRLHLCKFPGKWFNSVCFDERANGIGE